MRSADRWGIHPERCWDQLEPGSGLIELGPTPALWRSAPLTPTGTPSAARTPDLRQRWDGTALASYRPKPETAIISGLYLVWNCCSASLPSKRYV